jgi:hypothetical protein
VDVLLDLHGGHLLIRPSAPYARAARWTNLMMLAPVGSTGRWARC